MPIIGDIGDRLDLDVRKGVVFGPINVELLNPDGSPVDITGCTFESSISRREVGSAILAQFDIDVINLNPAKFEFNLPVNIIELLECGNTHRDSKSIYKWGMKLIDSLNRPLQLFYGQITVWQEV